MQIPSSAAARATCPSNLHLDEESDVCRSAKAIGFPLDNCPAPAALLIILHQEQAHAG